MKRLTPLLGILAGLLALDVLLDLPGFSLTAGSLLQPSIDLLVVAALLVVGAQSGESARGALRLVALVLLLLFGVYATGKRFGFDVVLRLLGSGSAVLQAASCLVSLLVVAAAAAIGWLATGLVLRGLQTGLARSIFLVAVALVAILQVLTGNRVLAPSVLPRMARDIAALFG